MLYKNVKLFLHLSLSLCPTKWGCISTTFNLLWDSVWGTVDRFHHRIAVSLSPYQRAQEEVHSKELKVKLLTDSVNSFIAKAPPTAHDALHSELDVLTANYQRLCSRLDGKCKTLEVRCFTSRCPPPFKLHPVMSDAFCTCTCVSVLYLLCSLFLTGSLGMLVWAAVLPGAGERLLGSAGAETGRDRKPTRGNRGVTGGAGCKYGTIQKEFSDTGG